MIDEDNVVSDLWGSFRNKKMPLVAFPHEHMTVLYAPTTVLLLSLSILSIFVQGNLEFSLKVTISQRCFIVMRYTLAVHIGPLSDFLLEYNNWVLLEASD